MAAKPKRKPKTQAKATCGVCRKTMKQVTPAHLATHGFSVARYERMYGARPTPSSTERASVDASLPAKVGDRLLDDQVWLGLVSNEVGERMLNGPLRSRLGALLTTMLFQRAQVTAEAMTILHAGLSELKADWRLTHGGPDHGPTPIEDVLRIVDRASRLVGDAEQSLQRAIKLALDEQKAAAEYADGIGPSLYSGQAEKAGPLATLPPGDREAVRILTNRIVQALAKRRDPVDVNALVTTPHPPGATPAPGAPGLSPLGALSRVPGNTGNDAIGHVAAGHDAIIAQALDSNDGIDSGAHPHAPGAPPATPPGSTMPSSTSCQRGQGAQGEKRGTPPTLPTSVQDSQGRRPTTLSDADTSMLPEDDDIDLQPQADDIETPAQKRAKRKVKAKRKAAASKRAQGSAGRQPKKATKKTMSKKAKKRKR